MAVEVRLSRTVRHATTSGDREVGDAELLSLPLPAVVLGEPGSGKTDLLQFLGVETGAPVISARRLLRRREDFGPDEVVLIDGLDELSARREGDRVQLVLEKLAALGHPAFIIACRAADWDEKTGEEEIRADYGRAPTVVSLLPLSLPDARRFLEHRLDVERADRALSGLKAQSMTSLTENPLTLQMVADVVSAGGALPTSRSGLIQSAVEILRREVNHAHRSSDLSLADPDDLVLASGACCASLLVTGSAAVWTGPRGEIDADDVGVASVERLPAGGLAGAALKSRLFRSAAAERFEPVHRLLAEFLAAKYLAWLVSSGIPAHRVRSMLRSRHTVPAAVRGVNAWLPGFDQGELGSAAIREDPYGILQYGDASVLAPEQRAELMRSLVALSREDPYFRSADRSSGVGRGLAVAELGDEIVRVVDERATVHLTTLLLASLAGSPVAEANPNWLRGLVLDPTRYFVERNYAVTALRSVDAGEDWSHLIETLLHECSEDSTRLAVECLADGLIDRVSDDTTADALLAFLGLPTIYGRPEPSWSHISGPAWMLGRTIPAERAAGILDALASRVELRDVRWVDGRFGLAHVVRAALEHAIARGEAEADSTWGWLQFLADVEGSGELERLDLLLAEDSELRWGIQVAALSRNDHPYGVHAAAANLPWVLPSLTLKFDDVARWLRSVGSSPGEWAPEQRDDWVEMVRLCRRRDGLPEVVGAAARRIASLDSGLLAEVESLDTPFDISEHDERMAERRNRLADAERDERRRIAEFASHEDLIRAADAEWIQPLASDYLNHPQEQTAGLSRSDALAHRYGRDVAVAALAGFEFALTKAAFPTADDVLRSRERGMYHVVTHAALAGAWERVASGKGFDDIPTTRTAALWFTAHFQGFRLGDCNDLLDGLEVVLAKEPGLLRELWGNLIEPQLAAGVEHVDGLKRFAEHAPSAVRFDLADSWLRTQPVTQTSTAVLIDGLIRTGDRRVTHLANERLAAAEDQDAELLWLSVLWLAPVDPLDPPASLDNGASPPECLLWEIRDRLSACDSAPTGFWASAPAIGRVVGSFRSTCPWVRRPKSSSGTKNPWDATEFLTQLLARLATDKSALATKEFEALVRDDDDYTDLVRHHAAQHRRLVAETWWEPQTVEAFTAVAKNAAPRSAEDLQGSIVAALHAVASRLRGNPTRALDVFYDEDGVPRNENYCRDRVAEWIERELPHCVHAGTEVRMPNDKQADFAFVLAEYGLVVPLEAKGQWHAELWTAASSQLAALYSTHHCAGGHGVYVVFWFGSEVPSGKRLKRPPGEEPVPTSAAELEQALRPGLPTEERQVLDVFVFDLERR